MKSNTKSTVLLPTGSRADVYFDSRDKLERIDICREGLTEWLLMFGTRWVSWREIGDMVPLGHPETEGYLVRRQGSAANGGYLDYRLTDKGLEFINER